jgi:hypothetical protein
LWVFGELGVVALVLVFGILLEGVSVCVWGVVCVFDNMW